MDRSGFTLIEGMVVVLVLGVIATITVASFSTASSSTGAALAGPAVVAALADASRLVAEDFGGECRGQEDSELCVVGMLERYGFSAVSSLADPAPGSVSILVGEGLVAVSAPSSGGRCLLAEAAAGGSAGDAGWYLISTADGRCSAQRMSSRAELFAPGSFSDPVVVG